MADLFYMLPRSTKDAHSYGNIRDAKTPTNGAISFPIRSQFSRFGYPLICQFRHSARFAMGLAMFVVSIPHVVCARPKEKMVWINAESNIALVANEKPARDGSVFPLPCNSVSLNLFNASPLSLGYNPISATCCTGPQNASVRFWLTNCLIKANIKRNRLQRISAWLALRLTFYFSPKGVPINGKSLSAIALAIPATFSSIRQDEKFSKSTPTKINWFWATQHKVSKMYFYYSSIFQYQNQVLGEI